MRSRVRIGDIATINSTYSKTKDCSASIDYIDTGSVTQGRIEEIQYLIPGKDAIPSRAKRRVKDQSIIYSTVRPNQKHYAILDSPSENTVVSTGFAVIDCDCNKIIPRYCYYVLTQPCVTAYLQGIAEQAVSTFPALNPSDIASLEIEIPSLEKQKRIVEIARTIDSKIELNNRINDYLVA